MLRYEGTLHLSMCNSSFTINLFFREWFLSCWVYNCHGFLSNVMVFILLDLLRCYGFSLLPSNFFNEQNNSRCSPYGSWRHIPDESRKSEKEWKSSLISIHIRSNLHHRIPNQDWHLSERCVSYNQSIAQKLSLVCHHSIASNIIFYTRGSQILQTP